MLRPGTFALTLLLSLLTALGPLTMDMYLPSLPAIGEALGAPPVQVQLTISSYLLGFAVGQIIYGPISDRIGRRRCPDGPDARPARLLLQRHPRKGPMHCSPPHSPAPRP